MWDSKKKTIYSTLRLFFYFTIFTQTNVALLLACAKNWVLKKFTSSWVYRVLKNALHIYYISTLCIWGTRTNNDKSQIFSKKTFLLVFWPPCIGSIALQFAWGDRAVKDEPFEFFMVPQNPKNIQDTKFSKFPKKNRKNVKYLGNGTQQTKFTRT